MKKKLYEKPEAELITVRFEGNFCATGPFSDQGTEISGEDPEEDL